jgi:CheY-like chemotaxis protein
MTRVLVVDDNPLNAGLVRIILTRAEHEVDVVSSGAAALALLASKPIDVVVSDISMPEMTGEDLCRAIRRDPALAALRVVAYTALAMRTEQDAIMAAGFDQLVTKPATRDALLEAVSVSERGDAAGRHGTGR